MKTNKEQVFDFIKLHSKGGAERGVSTKYIAGALNMQRTNVSSILNALYEESKIAKTNGRPVLYHIKTVDAEANADKCFTNLVGFNGSLKRAVQLAKAAVLYPEKSLNTVILGARGTGKSFLVMLMHKFAIESGILPPDANFLIFNCREYVDNEQLAINELFGTKDKEGFFADAAGGVLFIDNGELLSARVRSLIISRSTDVQQDYDSEKQMDPMVIVSCNDKNRGACDDFASNLPIVINLPPLNERPLIERMTMIQKFLTLESARLKKTISINAELLRCLLLYDCEGNCMQLKGDIKSGCANAYVREHNSGSDSYQLFVGDFGHHVRKGFLKYKAYRDEIESIIPSDYSYSFSENSMEMSAIDREKLKHSSFYDNLERMAASLSAKGLEDEDINLVLSAEVENTFRNYKNELSKQVVNKEQLSMLVDKRIIDMVQAFLDEASLKLGRNFSNSVFYGLCLHLNSALNRESQNSVPPEQITKIIENYKAEYSLSLEFSARLNQSLGTELSIDEVVLITMFISYEAPIFSTSGKPVVLFAFYGSGVADSIAKTILSLTELENVFAFELSFEKEPEEIYASLKQYISKIERGKGVIVVYDGNFLSEMLLSIEEELKIVIRQLPIPVITIGVELARKAAINENVDTTFQSVIKGIYTYNTDLKRTIVTLCTTGKGGAEELKKYIERYGQVENTEIHCLAILDRDRLREELVKIMNQSYIQCIVGTYDPELFAIPFISIDEVFSTPKDKLPLLLKLNRVEKQDINYEEVYSYLDEQLEHTNVSKLKKMLPVFISGVNEKICEMSLDSEVGLFIHTACLIDLLRSNISAPENIHREDIIEKYNWQFKELLKLLKPLEKAFDVIFNDDEAANILTIIYKL
jgi:transcriptional regulatory protein LevR